MRAQALGCSSDSVLDSIFVSETVIEPAEPGSPLAIEDGCGKNRYEGHELALTEEPQPGVLRPGLICHPPERDHRHWVLALTSSRL